MKTTSLLLLSLLVSGAFGPAYAATSNKKCQDNCLRNYSITPAELQKCELDCTGSETSAVVTDESNADITERKEKVNPTHSGNPNRD